MEISNIDDLLSGTKTAIQPETPEHRHQPESESSGDKKTANPDYGIEEEEPLLEENTDESISETNEELDDDHEDKPSFEEDDFGNKTEQLSKSMQKRLERQAKKYQSEIDQLRHELASNNANPAVQKAAQNFQYNPTEEGDWQHQLSSLIKQTVQQMGVEQQEAQQNKINREAHLEFEMKFTHGMERFNDFREVVGSQPIDDAMTLALRALSDPSAFIYAASKQQPQELERISKLRDPYVRMVEMGKLEERMRRNKSTTKAPKPLQRIKEDASIPVGKKQKEETIEDLIAKSNVKKINQMKARLGK